MAFILFFINCLIIASVILLYVACLPHWSDCVIADTEAIILNKDKCKILLDIDNVLRNIVLHTIIFSLSINKLKNVVLFFWVFSPV